MVEIWQSRTRAFTRNAHLLFAIFSEERMKEQPNVQRISGIPALPCDPSGSFFPHPVCGPGNSLSRAPIHKAVCEMDMAAVHQELSDSIGAASLHRKDGAGYLPIHSACALSLMDPENSSVACEITRLLLAAGGDASAVDGKRNTPLHWAARSGDPTWKATTGCRIRTACAASPR